MDLSETIQLALYKKSGIASKNTDPDFLLGYGAGKDSGDDSTGDIEREWRSRGEPVPPKFSWECFCEWKRGYWAARMQRACAKSVG